MHSRQQTVIAVVALLIVGSLTFLGAQASIEGELATVDPDAMTFTIETADGEQQFAYAPTTEVVGAQGGAAGLATLTGRSVVVHYEASAEEGQPAMATRIEVRS